jgi:hypothetical protein
LEKLVEKILDDVEVCGMTIKAKKNCQFSNLKSSIYSIVQSLENLFFTTVEAP